MRTVTAPDGATWSVKRHWISRRPKWRRRKAEMEGGGNVLDIVDFGFSFFDEGGPAIVGVVVVLVLLLFFTGFFVFIIEALIVAVAIALTLAAKILFRRPWFVEADNGGGYRRRWAVVGWNRSGEIVDEVARSLEAGVPFVSADARDLGIPIPETERAAPDGGV